MSETPTSRRVVTVITPDERPTLPAPAATVLRRLVATALDRQERLAAGPDETLGLAS
jgi:hypothetical protein